MNRATFLRLLVAVPTLAKIIPKLAAKPDIVRPSDYDHLPASKIWVPMNGISEFVCGENIAAGMLVCRGDDGLIYMARSSPIGIALSRGGENAMIKICLSS